MEHNDYGQREYMTRVQTRRQLGQWHECWGIHAQSEQYTDQYQYQHWFPRRQELYRSAISLWERLPKWLLITVAARGHLEISRLGCPGRLCLMAHRPNMTVGGEYLPLGRISLLACSGSCVCG